MKSDSRKSSLLYTLIMGLMTVSLSLAVADGVFGLSQLPADAGRELVGEVFLWCGLILLPLLFFKKLKWKYTLLNLPLYFILYFPVYDFFGVRHYHKFLESGGFIGSPPLSAALVAVSFWVIQSIVLLLCGLISYAVKKLKKQKQF